MWKNIICLTPEIYLSTITILLLGFGVIYSKLEGEIAQQKKITWLSIATLVITFLLEIDQYGLFQLYITDASLFGVDSTIVAIKLVIILGSISILLLSLDTYTTESKHLRNYEYTQLILLATVGMLLLVSSKDLISLYLSIELVSLSLYILAAINRDGQYSTEAGIKYFLLGSVASGILLLGSALIYWLTGETSFIGLTNYIWYGPIEVGVAALFIIIALLFKLAAAPFHVWAPDVYEGSPSIVTAFFAIVPKLATLGIFYEVLTGPFQAILEDLKPFLIASAILSIIVGSLGAINQTKLKRLVSYSAIAHMGFMLLGLSTGTINGVIATYIYIVIYMVTSLNTFAFILSLSNKSIYISQLAGLSRLNPTLAFTFALSLFSMAGIPPLAGFLSKYLVLMSIINNQYYIIAVIAIIMSVIGAFYYLRLIKWMFFKDSFDYQLKILSGIALNKPVELVNRVSFINSIILGTTLYVLLTFLFYPNVLMNFLLNSLSIII